MDQSRIFSKVNFSKEAGGPNSDLSLMEAEKQFDSQSNFNPLASVFRAIGRELRNIISARRQKEL